jgi:hypothetical protein
MVVTQAPMRQLELVREAKVFNILGKRLDARLEASGVLAKDGLFYVIFDNMPHIARRDGQIYLLGLCEGNRCRGGDEGRIPGGGRVHVFRRGDRHWERVGKIRLPETVLFEDYSGIALAGDRIAVISQESSALWIGNLAPSDWQVTGPGTCYALPRGADGGIVYGTVEGVSWPAPDQLVMVSDKAKPEHDPRCRDKDQSIHIFRVPVP